MGSPCESSAFSGVSNASGLVTGGDGVSIWDAMKQVTSYCAGGTFTGDICKADATMLEDGGILDAPVTLTVLGGSVLTIGAVAVEKKFNIGSTIGSYFWDLVGSGFGTSTVVCNGSTGFSLSAWQQTLPIVGGAFPGGAGGSYYNIGTSCGSYGAGNIGMFVAPDGSVLSDAAVQCASPSDTLAQADQYNALVANVMSKPGQNVFYGSTSTCSSGPAAGTQYRTAMRVVTPPTYDAAFTGPLAPYTGQTVDATAGYANPATGAGMEPQPGSGTKVAAPTSLSSSDPSSLCVLINGVRECGNPYAQGTFVQSQMPDGGPSGSNGSLYQWLRCKNDPQDYICPTVTGTTVGTDGTVKGATSFTMPSCAGQTVGNCELAIQSAYGVNHWAAPAFTTTAVPDTQADLTYQPGAVLSTSPDAGALVTSAPGTVALTTNPVYTVVLVPYIAPWQLGSAYCSAAIALGLGCTTVTNPEPGVSTSGPSEATAIDPSSPQPGQKVKVGTTITVDVNPSDAPYPPNDPNGSNPPVNAGACGVTVPTLDFTPLSSTDVGTKFPFGLLTWFTNGITAWSGSSTAPTFTVPLLGPDNGTSGITADFSVLNPFMPLWRSALLIAATIGMVWGIATGLLGFMDWPAGQQGSLF